MQLAYKHNECKKGNKRILQNTSQLNVKIIPAFNCFYLNANWWHVLTSHVLHSIILLLTYIYAPIWHTWPSLHSYGMIMLMKTWHGCHSKRSQISEFPKLSSSFFVSKYLLDNIDPCLSKSAENKLAKITTKIYNTWSRQLSSHVFCKQIWLVTGHITQ